MVGCVLLSVIAQRTAPNTQNRTAHRAPSQSDLQCEATELRERLLAAETARDSARLRLHALRQAAVDASGGGGLPAAAAEGLQGGASETDVAMRPASGSPETVAARSDGDGEAAAEPAEREEATDGERPALRGRVSVPGDMFEGIEADVDVIAELRSRICDLEGQLRQARTLQRAQSSMLQRGARDGAAAAAAAAVAAAGAHGRRAVHFGSARGTSAGGGVAGPLAHGGRYGMCAGGAAGAPAPQRGFAVHDEDGGLDGEASTPLTPARRPDDDELIVPLEVGARPLTLFPLSTPNNCSLLFT
jgi:hypothetical protein